MIINLNTGENVNKFLFPDNQPHINIGELDVSKVDVICSITNSQKLVELCMLKNALENRKIQINALRIPYLAGARYDRIMGAGDSMDLQVYAEIINNLNAYEVYLYDVHSDVAPALIKNSRLITNKALVQSYDKPDSVLIIPDANAAKKSIKYGMWNKNLVDYIQCLKNRDITTGEILGVEIFRPEKCIGRDCVLIDDLCDGGRTFIEIKKSFDREIGTDKMNSITLIVTHGLFSQGFAELEKHFNEIITSNTLFRTYDSKIVKQINFTYGES